jgi:hypothetical protein
MYHKNNYDISNICTKKNLYYDIFVIFLDDTMKKISLHRSLLQYNIMYECIFNFRI